MLKKIFYSFFFCAGLHAMEKPVTDSSAFHQSYADNLEKGFENFTLVVCATGNNKSFSRGKIIKDSRDALQYPKRAFTLDLEPSLLKNIPHIKENSLVYKIPEHFKEIYIERPPADEFLEKLLKKYYKDFSEDKIKRKIMIEWDPYLKINDPSCSFCGHYDGNVFLNGFLYFIEPEITKENFLKTFDPFIEKGYVQPNIKKFIVELSKEIDREVKFFKEKKFWNFKHDEELKREVAMMKKDFVFFMTKVYSYGSIVAYICSEMSVEKEKDSAIEYVKQLGFQNVVVKQKVESPVNGRKWVSLLEFDFIPQL